MNDLQSALRDALATTQDISPAGLDATDLALWQRCDDRCADIIDRLISEFDEAGPEARALLQGFRLP